MKDKRETAPTAPYLICATQPNRDLHLIQELTLILQSSVDPVELEEAIVRGLVEEMGYRRAVIGLFEQGDQVLSSWLTMENMPISAESQQMGHTEAVPLNDLNSPIIRAIRTQHAVEVLDGKPPTGMRQFDERLAAGKHYIILPLALRDSPLGVILLDHLPASQPLSDADRHSLERLAAHAGVALGSVQLCINRAQREAIVEERNRIAADLHDSISQVLYGLAYGLDACIQLLPDHPDVVRSELQKLHPVVADAQAQMRTAIFDMRAGEIGSDTFSARLHRHLNAIRPARSPALRIELPGEFEQLPAEIRYDLFRIAQEAMTNAARHADAQRIVITVAQDERQIEVRVEDDGRGFEPQDVDAAHHLGIQSMTERVERLGGVLDIDSTASDGTVVSATIPQ